jgi:hypothetical protein
MRSSPPCRRWTLFVLPVLAVSVALGVAQAAASTVAPDRAGSLSKPPTPGLTTTVSAPRSQPAPPAVPNVVLYDQYNNAGTFSTGSQNFEAANDPFDDFLADDFVVPTGQSWSITNVEAQGVYFNGAGPASSFDVTFYSNNSTTDLPGARVGFRTNQSFSAVAGDFSVALSPAVFLNSGTYWVSVQANENFSPNGEWGWTDRTVQSNAGAAWQNPGGAFGLCTTWTRATSCIAGKTAPDQVFRLSGTVGTPSAYLNPNAIVVNDGTAASPYPSTVAVSGLSGTVTKVTVDLIGFGHGKPVDVDLLLVGPGGQQATIMSDAGGSALVSGLNITLDGAAGAPISGTSLASGTFQPTNLGSELDSFPLPAPVVTGFPTGPSALSVFNGTPPTGIWSLYAVDDATGGTGIINTGWVLTVTTSGSPATGFGNLGAITINDRAASPLPATAYPSSIVVGGFAGNVSHMSVRLGGLRHTFPSDVDVMLAGPVGQNAIIMSDVGSSIDVQNVTLTLDDAAAAPLPILSALTTGPFQPTNSGTGDTFPAPAPAPSGGSALSTFTGTSPNGTWNLWVVDDASVDGGYFTDGWSMNFTGPTAVGLARLSAEARGKGVLVRWQTSSEAQLAGFDLYRGTRKLNGSMIVARHGGEARGAQYRFLDRTAGSGTSHLYRLELVRPDGTRALGGRTLVATSR